MTNFDYLKKEKEFHSFVDIAIVAEKTYKVDSGTCILNCRRSLEAAIKWMYSVDSELTLPYKDNLYVLLYNDAFRNIIGEDNWKRLEFIRVYGNKVSHTTATIDNAKDVAKVCLKNLFYFMDWIDYCYGSDYEQKDFDESLLEKEEAPLAIEPIKEIDINLQELIEENKSLKDQLSERRFNQQLSYVTKPLNLSEYSTRKLYIDAMLIDSGWTENKDWLNEVKISGIPNKSGFGYADYVLYDDSHKPLAIIEAKKTCVDISQGRQQAIVYANAIEKKFNRRPVIFLTNGFDTKIIDNQYPERKVSSIYSKRDLEKYFNLMSTRSHLKYIEIDKNIAGRYYQQEAIKAVCETFDIKNKRKALLVMATGSGKTRTVIGLVDVLLKNCWIRNVLFLADRNALVTQAKRNFVNLLPNLSAVNLVEDKANYNAHAVFSTYQTMMSCIDTVKEGDQRLYTCGHFDLIICDEAHRSIYNKYKDIFNYFDAPLIGLTATPRDEIDKNTYKIFELENGVPTYGYELAQAVSDHYLVNFLQIETKLKFMSEGINYDDLSEEEKEEYEETFAGDYRANDGIDSSALNSWVFNEDTIKKVLQKLFELGLKINYGQKIGKTIIFAQNHKHAEKIFEIFNKEYPELNGYAKVIDNYTNYSQSIIDEFSDANKLPQIAISVDMLDTGIDIPEVLNLVFFKKVKSKAKFWQMIGRGTRLCPYLIDGKDKGCFYIFDFCGNFEFFRMSNGVETPTAIPVQSSIFNIKFELVYKLQELNYQTDELKAWRNKLIDELVTKVKELDRNKFDVKQHLKYVDLYCDKENYNSLTFLNLLEIKDELAPLIKPDNDDINAVRFDLLMYKIELATLKNEESTRSKNDLLKKSISLAAIGSISEIEAQKGLLNKIINTDFINEASIADLEIIRINLRNLIKYIPKKEIVYYTDFEDEMSASEIRDSNIESNYLQNYKQKLEYYIRQHEADNPVIAKLKDNKPLNKDEIKQLESVVWGELGSKQDYYSEVGEKPLGEFIREIVGLDMKAAKEAFAKYIDERDMNSNQIYFVNQIIEFIHRNGMLKDKGVLKDSPFVDKGTVYELFGKNMGLWKKIENAIEDINKNAETISYH